MDYGVLIDGSLTTRMSVKKAVRELGHSVRKAEDGTGNREMSKCDKT
jgi:hypothetical protein